MLPRSAPDLPPGGHFHDASPDGTGQVELSWTQADGLASLPLGGQMARQLLSTASAEATRWTAAPGVVALAERWLGAPSPCGAVTSVHWRRWPRAGTCATRARPQARGTKALRQFLRTFLRPQWRPVRWGLAALLCSNWQG